MKKERKVLTANADCSVSVVMTHGLESVLQHEKYADITILAELESGAIVVVPTAFALIALASVAQRFKALATQFAMDLCMTHITDFDCILSRILVVVCKVMPRCH